MSGRQRELAVLAGLLLIAAAARFVGLPGRGTWDADQGHDMLILYRLLTEGAVPLLGPPTSIGTFHHGALYYWLLAPAAAVSGTDPTIVVSFIAATGVIAVALVWWLAREIGGPAAGAAAGLLAAISPAAIDESTFIWNPNLIPLAASVALAAAWRGWTTGELRWWLLAAVGATTTAQLHVLGLVFAVPVASLFVVQLSRLERAALRPALATAGAALAIMVAGYLPLAIHELQTGGTELRAIGDYLAGDRGSGDGTFADRLAIVALRVVSWPFVGVITAAPLAGGVIGLLLVGAVAWRLAASRGLERQGVAWLSLSLLWCVVTLSIAAPSLARIVPGLPNDHYHAFADPIVFSLAGIAIGALATAHATTPARRPLGPVLATVVAVALGLNAIGRWPPAVAEDGGWPEAQRVTARISGATPDDPIELVSLPAIKTAEAYGFPLVRTGRDIKETASALSPSVVIICDSLFVALIGAACGGPAEDRYLAGRPDGPTLELVDRFASGPRRTISVYVRAGD